MRAGEGIWHFEEFEESPRAGERRPLLIWDEQVAHLAHTDKQLTMSELYERVRRILEEYKVPVDLRIVSARWLNDEKETRERLVASMRDHVYKDIKMIMGLDYMGRWASFQILVGTEPETVKVDRKWTMPFDVQVALGMGGLLFLIGLKFESLLAAGILAIGYAVVRIYLGRKAAQEAEKREKEQAEERKMKERHSRTYKFDDTRLFATAMRAVFQSVIDDIVQRGATVVRISGGRGEGGMFDDGSKIHSAPTARISNASDKDV